MNKQEFKITNTESGSSVYFFQHSLQSAAYWTERYVTRNKGKFPMAVYRVNDSSFGPRWILMRTE